MKLNNRGNWSLIGLLIVVVIVVVAVAMYFGNSGGISTVKSNSKLLDQKSQKQTVLGKAIDTGKATDCQERLKQIRMGIETYKTTNGSERNPQSFKDIGLGVGSEYFQCPVSKQPYTYDPATGTVKCPTHTSY